MIKNILLDLQPLQGESKYRGIGRVTKEISMHMFEIETDRFNFQVVFNDINKNEINKIREDFPELFKKCEIFTLKLPYFSTYFDIYNYYKNTNAFITPEIALEQVYAKAASDFVLITSFFEWSHPTSLKKIYTDTLYGVVAHDLIPLIFEKHYLSEESVKAWYYYKLKEFQNADIYFSVSNAVKKDLIDYLNIDEQKIITIYNAADAAKFYKLNIGREQLISQLKKFNIHKDFILYVPGGNDYRKNIKGLLKSFSLLPYELKEKYQLVITSSIHDKDKYNFKKFMSNLGLYLNKNVIFTGYVSDEDLLKLYNATSLFVFPSLYEGFGLPILEAMYCHTPVIGSNVSGIPEIINMKEALFNPYNENSIAKLIFKALTNKGFKKHLVENSIRQKEKFTWEKTIKNLVKGINSLQSKKSANHIYVNFESSYKPSLAYLSPLPPEETGVSYYSFELLNELSKYYDITLVSNENSIAEPLKFQFPVIDVNKFINTAKEYERVLYNIGNSEFHIHMFDLIEEVPGIVILHDFFLSDVMYWMDMNNRKNFSFLTELYKSHGWTSLNDYLKNGVKAVIEKYPINKSVLNNSIGIIVHSNHAKNIMNKYYSIVNEKKVHVIPQLKKINKNSTFIHNASKKEFIISSFGIIHNRKAVKELLEAYALSKLSKKNTKLIFVGKFLDSTYEEKIKTLVNELNISEKVIFTGFVSDDDWKKYLHQSDLVVQLRKSSRGESSRALLDALSAGKPVIVNNFASFEEIPDDVVYKIGPKIMVNELSKALEDLYSQKNLREKLANNAIHYVKKVLNPSKIAKKFYDSIEKMYKNDYTLKIFKKIKMDTSTNINYKAKFISYNLEEDFRQKQLFVDISSLLREKIHTGIQRVIKNQLIGLIENPPDGFRIEPVYLTKEEGKWHYKYARRFISQYLGLNLKNINDEYIDCQRGDILYSPDWNPIEVYEAFKDNLYDRLKLYGVKLVSLVYDLIPIKYPEFTFDYVSVAHKNWIDSITKTSDKIICISKTVRDELREYLKNNNFLNPDLEITYLHLGVDFKKENYQKMSKKEEELLKQLKLKNYFLMVSTLEPRKGYEDILSAFEILWKKGFNNSLVIVGKKGWKVDNLISRIINHPLFNKKLFWLGYVSNPLLKALYKNALATIIASKTEGFGLPIIEAAYHNTPVIARDIPVFKEIAKEGAYYFKSKNPYDIAMEIEKWLHLYYRNMHPKPQNIKYMNWQEHIEKLKEIILR